MKKAPKNGKNYQISGIFGISRHILENIFCKVYKSIHHQKDNSISPTFHCFLFDENILYTP